MSTAAMRCFLVEVTDNVEGASSCLFGLIGISPQQARVYLSLMEKFAEVEGSVEESLVEMVYWDYSVLYVDSEQLHGWFDFMNLDWNGVEMFDIDEAPYHQLRSFISDTALYRTDCDRVSVDRFRIYFKAHCHYGNARFETCSFSKEQLEEIANDAS
jgi:hypothetical protein